MLEGNKWRLREAQFEIEDLLKSPKGVQHIMLRIVMLQDSLNKVLNDLILRPEVNEHERPV